MFCNTSIIDIDLSLFDTSEIISMKSMFANCYYLKNINLQNKNLSKVTIISEIFINCENLQNVSFNNIDASNIIYMESIFTNCKNLTNINFINVNFSSIESINNTFTNISYYNESKITINFENIDFSNLLNMEKTFYNCLSLKEINFKNIVNPKVISVEEMFNNTYNLQYVSIDNIIAPNIENINGLFSFSFKLDKLIIKNLNLIKLKSIDKIIYCNYTKTKKLYDISIFENIDLSNLEELNAFRNCPYGFRYYYFKNINLSNLSTMEKIFEDAMNIRNVTLENLDISKATSMKDMVHNANYEMRTYVTLKNIKAINCVSVENMLKVSKASLIIFKNINISKIQEINDIFTSLNDNFYLLDIILENVDFSNLVKINNISNNRNEFKITFKNINFSKLSSVEKMVGTYEIYPNNLYDKYNYHCNLIEIKLENINFMIISSLSRMFAGCNHLEKINFTNVNISKVVTMEEFCYNCHNLKSLYFNNVISDSIYNINKFLYCDYYHNWNDDNKLTIRGFNTSTVKTMENFICAQNLVSLDLGDFNTSSAINMKNMFKLRKISSINLTTFNTSSVVNMEGMFASCENLISLNLSNFNASLVTNMNQMFYNCSKLKNLNLYNFNPKLINMDKTFYGCTSLESLNLGFFDISLITNIYNSFEGLTNLRHFILSNVITDGIKNMQKMFYGMKYLVSLDLSNFKTEKVTDFSQMFYGCEKLENINSNFNTASSINNAFEQMFYNCKNLKSIDLSHFETSSINSTKEMFYGCENIEELNLTKFNTNLVKNMDQMFSNCKKLKSIDLTFFDTRNVLSMENMFSNCSNIIEIHFKNINTNLINSLYGMFQGCYQLQYVNLKNIKLIGDINITNIFLDTPNNFIYCIYNELNALALKKELELKNETINDCAYCQGEKKYVLLKDICVDECTQEDYSIYEYKKKCLDGCPLDSPYEIFFSHKCIEECPAEDFFKEKCKINNNNQSILDKTIDMISNQITKGLVDLLILSTILEKNEDLIIKTNDVIYQLTSTENQDKNNYQDISSIFLLECEQKLKNYYNINQNESLIIFKIDYYIPGFLIPIVEYEVYHPQTKILLDLDICQNENIIISMPISIDEEQINKHNPTSDIYNDKCYPYTSVNNTDVILNDRKNEYNKNNLSICEKNCTFSEYNSETKKVSCECKPKTKIEQLKNIDINKDKLLHKFTDFDSLLNFDIIFCTNILFSFKGLISNIGSYTLICIVIINGVSCCLFILKEYPKILTLIEEIFALKNKNLNDYDNNKNCNDIKSINNNNEIIYNNNDKNKNNNKLAELNTPPKKNILQTTTFKSTIELKKDTKDDISKINNLESNKNNQKISLKTKSMEFTENEINSLNYEEALLFDKRTYFQYYISLLKTKQVIFFTFLLSNDYNSRIIKITLFFFSFALLYFVNSLFFQDSTMHKIYEDNGNFDFIYQVPKIIYSTIISTIITLLIKFLSLTENNIIKFKKDKNDMQDSNKIGKLIKCLILKFILYFVTSILLLFIFWYYLSCFGSVYKNTQIHLIKDTLMSFLLSLIYPFILSLLPGIFRIPSLKNTKNRKILYGISKLLQLI